MEGNRGAKARRVSNKRDFMVGELSEKSYAMESSSSNRAH
jgi:hypothetical protein